MDSAAYYEIFRIHKGGKPLFIAATKEQEWFDPQVTSSIADKYKYAVRACASGVKGRFSDSVSPVEGEITDNTPPETPVLHAVAREKQRIDLFWTPVYENTQLSHYEIYRNGEKIAATANPYVCSYRDRTVRFGNTYTYSVTAVDKCNNKSVSETVEVQHTSDILADSDRKISKQKQKSLYALLRLKK